jgi:membrane protein
VKAAVARFGASRAGRAWKRYADARGNILAAGVGYFAFFSIFPAAALALVVFGFVLREHHDLLHRIFDHLSDYLPGLVQNAQYPQGLIKIQAPPALALSVAGVIAFLTLVLAGLGWLGAVREGIRAVFGVQGPAGNLIINKVRDLGVLFTLGLGIALLAVLSTVVGAGAGWVADGIGLAGEDWVVVLAGFALSVLADTALMIILLRVVSGVRVPWRDLLQGALVGGVGFSLLKISAAALLPRLTANPLFASFAIVVGLLIWLNLIARLTLLSAAWAANDIDEIHEGGSVTRVRALSGEEPLGVSGPAAIPARPVAVLDSSLPTFGERSGDRTAVVSGVVLGVAGVAVSGALTRGLRSVVRIVRG